MSLEHELVELNTAYQNSREDVLMLQERVQELEQLVRDAQPLMEKHSDTIGNLHGLLYTVKLGMLPEIEAWQERATAALQQE